MGVVESILAAINPSHKQGSTFVTLESASSRRAEGTPLVVRAGAKPLPRISTRELKLAYLQDPLVFNTINKITQLMLAAGYKLKGDPTAIQVVEDFLDGIGSNGSNMDKDSVMELSFKNSLIFGKAFNEKVLSKRGGNIIDLEPADPENVDLARDYRQNYVLDANNNPIGYVETLQPFVTQPRVVIPFPKDVWTGIGNSLFIPADRMMHFRLYTTGDGISEFGLIEPVYKNVQMKKNIEESFASFLARLGYPMLYGKVGDANHEPSEEQVKNFLEEMRGIKNNNVFSMPYYNEIGIMEPKSPEKMQEHLVYFRDEILAGLGVPTAFATGAGESTNRSTLNRQEYIMKIALKDVMRRHALVWEKQLFKIICEQAGLSTYPRMVWNEIALEELDSKSKRLQGYAQVGLLSPDQTLEKYIRLSEDLPDKSAVTASPPTGGGAGVETPPDVVGGVSDAIR